MSNEIFKDERVYIGGEKSSIRTPLNKGYDPLRHEIAWVATKAAKVGDLEAICSILLSPEITDVAALIMLNQIKDTGLQEVA